MTIEQLNSNHSQIVHEIFNQVTNKLLENKVVQWNSSYPNKEIIENDLQEGTLYGIFLNEQLASVITINEDYEPCYDKLKWSWDPKDYLIVHRLATAPQFQGQGLAKEMMLFTEKLVVSRNKKAIRLDTMISNSQNMRFYKNLGYAEVGIVNFDRIIADFMCFEKSINLA